MTLAELRALLEAHRDEMRTIHDSAGDNPLEPEAQTRWDELVTSVESTEAEITRIEARHDRMRQMAQNPATSVAGDDRDDRPSPPNVNRQRDPFAVLENRSVGMSGRELRRTLVDSNVRAMEADGFLDTEQQANFERLVNRHAGNTTWAANILARQRPAYRSAWSKMMMGQPELLDDEERTALSVGSNTNGGYLVPTHLDPTIILTNSGTSNVIRGISRQVTLTTGNVWNGVTSAGVTASVDGELTEVSDDTPTFARVSISTYKMQAFVQASIESFEDIDALASDVLMLFADARDRLEGGLHATGTGSSQPWGIFSALDANTNVEITSTTAATIGLVDIHGLYRSVPVRWRGRGSWVMNPLYSLQIKALGTALSASYSTDITQPVADRLLGKPLIESDDAPTTQTTTALDNEIVYGDFSNFVIVDMPGGFSVEFIPHLFNVANNLPDGRRGWYAHWRMGSDSVNDLAFRLLQDRTSA